MVTEQERTAGQSLRIEGNEPLTVSVERLSETNEWTLVQDSLGFECASGEWIERKWVGIPVFELLDAVDIPGETTHVQFQSAHDERACIPLADLEDAIVAVGDGDGLPRLVSPHVIGPRTIKNLSQVRPLTLAPGEEREQYEDLPIDTG